MAALKGFCLAFSMYSKIPVPKAAWEEKNMRYALCFFPCIGLVIAAALWGLWELCFAWDSKIPTAVFVLTGTAMPVLITGGIHLDGFLDTTDARCSYQSRERKLEILKDSHIGAFACIGLLCWGLLFMAGLFLIQKKWQVLLAGCGFFLSRGFSAYGLISVKSAKQEGMLYTFASGADKKRVLICLGIWFLAALTASYIFGGWYGIFCVLAGTLVFLYYRRMALGEFGGLTGDLAGWFVTVYELAFVWLAGIGGCIWN